MFKHKLKASLVHLGLSLLLVSLIIGSIIFFWFPQRFIAITDFREVASIIIIVDLILGPLLTFVIFQPKKKTLKFDLSVIALIQISALLYGTYALYQIHPLFITFNIDRFTIVNARDADPEKAKYEEYKVSKFKSTQLAFVKMPEDPKKKNKITLSAAFGGGDLETKVEYYEPYKEHISAIVSKSLDPELILSHQDKKRKIQSFKNEYGEKINNYAFLPLNSATKDAIIVIDKNTAEPVTTINIDPWKLTKK